MKWEINDGSPIYIQLAETIKLAIVSGEWKSGEKVKSVRDLAIEAEVNPNTMQKALALLEQQGLLITNRTIGREVTDDTKLIATTRKTFATTNIEVFLSKMEILGYDTNKIRIGLEEIIEEENTNE